VKKWFVVFSSKEITTVKFKKKFLETHKECEYIIMVKIVIEILFRRTRHTRSALIKRSYFEGEAFKLGQPEL